MSKDMIDYCESCGEVLTRDGHQVLEASTCDICVMLLCLECDDDHSCKGEVKDNV